MEKGVPTGDKRPFQTEAPFLWMLAMLGYLPVSEGNTEYYTVDREGRKDADQLTWENLGMYGRSAGGYRSHGNRRGGGTFTPSLSGAWSSSVSTTDLWT